MMSLTAKLEVILELYQSGAFCRCPRFEGQEDNIVCVHEIDCTAPANIKQLLKIRESTNDN